MNIRCALFLLIISTIEVGSQEHCNKVYVCCKKLDTDCLEFCGPVFECDTYDKIDQEQKSTITEGTSEFLVENTDPRETTTFQTPQVQQVIGVSACRKGFQLDGKGRCKRVFK